MTELRVHSALYDVIHCRRDARREFTGVPVHPGVLRRILAAAHAAPSVGLTQPWDFIVVTDPTIRGRFRAYVLEELAVFAATLDRERGARFADIQIEGILEATLAIVVTYQSGAWLWK